MKWVAVLFTAFIIVVIVTADMGMLAPALRWLTMRGGDKVGHFMLFGLLNLFICLAFLSNPGADVKRIVLTVGLILFVLTGLEEWSQALFPTRTADPFDLLASWSGIAVFGWITYRIKKQGRPSRSPL